jgi:nitrilase
MKAAVVQATPVLFERVRTLEKVEQLTRQAAAEGARLILFPESFIPAYPRGLDFGTVVGSRSEAGRRQWQLYRDQALAIPGPDVERLAACARQTNTWLVIGVTEREEPGHTLYCSLLYFSPEGRLLARHRKLKPTGAERVIWGEGRGDDLAVLPTPAGRLGGLICWENYMPLARMALYQQQVEVYLAPTADARDSWQATLRHIACEGRCFVLGCNQYVAWEHYPASLQEAIAAQPEVACRGGSAIVDPYGNYLAGPVYDGEAILYAELDLTAIARAKMDFDVCGHYARPDVFAYTHLTKDS